MIPLVHVREDVHVFLACIHADIASDKWKFIPILDSILEQEG
jgi:hypothetical protein